MTVRSVRHPAAALLALAAHLAAQGQGVPAYQNPDAPLAARVNDLLGRMTLEEKVSQLMNDSQAIPRLGVPEYNWWNECLHGVARAGLATVFPEPIGMAAAWDSGLVRRIATVISDEARAKHHEFLRQGKRGIYQGLTFWTPNINLFRDPRWGRGMETYGEDPYLTGTLAVEFIQALQGDDPKYLKTVATAKHYAVHSGPEPLRHVFDARVSERDLRGSYLAHFEMAVKTGGAQSVMCAYNSVDGDPACANTRLLGEILRQEWGFTGYVVSDCGAIGDIYLTHKWAPNALEGVSRALKAGADLNCGTEYANLVAAAKQGLVTESDIDTALRRLLTARFRLGMFDPPERVPYAQIPYSELDSAPHRALALEAARKSIVLLKNQDGALPLRKDLKTVAVIGPNADDLDVLVGNYNGDPAEPITPLEGIRRKIGGSAQVIYARGSDLGDNISALEPVPSSALYTGNGPRRQHGLLAEYFNTANFNGRAYRLREMTWPNSGKFTGGVPRNPQPRFTRVDAQVDFHWWNQAPRQDMNDDDFGVRWTGYLAPAASGKYRLGATGMNAAELYLDNKLLVDFHNIHERSTATAEVNLEGGKLYALRLDFHEFLNDAAIKLVWAPPRGSLDDAALDAARRADAVILCLGLSPRLEGEEMTVPVVGFNGGDRVNIGLPRPQEDLLEKIVAVGKPVVLVLLNGSALAVGWARDHVPAIVEAWYPGQAGGDAIADVLFGDYNPAGRLPVTFYESESQLPAFDNYDMEGRTYRYFHGPPLYPFGYGLSYTKFTYGNLQTASGAISVDVENSGRVAGEEVVELFLKLPEPTLAGFRRIPLAPGEKRTAAFQLAPQSGPVEFSIGGKQAGFTGAIDAATTGVLTGRYDPGK